MNDMIITSVSNEPRLLDTDLAESLGYANPIDIRKLVRRYEDDLSCLGTISTVASVRKGARGSTNVTEFYLNKKQSLFIITKSETAKAIEMTIKVIEKFDAYERGAVVHPVLPQTYKSALLALVASVEETERLAGENVKLVEENTQVRSVIGAKKHKLTRFIFTLKGVHAGKVKGSLRDLGYFHNQFGPLKPYAKFDKFFYLDGDEESGNIDIFVTEEGKVLLAKLHAERKLALQLGCGETTVRRYRQVANTIGLTGSICAGGINVIQRVPRSMLDDAGYLLMGVADATCDEDHPAAKAINAKAHALITLLISNSTREDVAFIHAAAVKLADDADWFDE
jgi:phage regulator Rha-like protein